MFHHIDGLRSCRINLIPNPALAVNTADETYADGARLTHKACPMLIVSQGSEHDIQGIRLVEESRLVVFQTQNIAVGINLAHRSSRPIQGYSNISIHNMPFVMCL